MSQVKFTATLFWGSKPDMLVEVMAGWDRPLQHYFLTVFDLDATDDESETLWSTLEYPDEAADQAGTVRLQEQLKSMNITAPDGFWERVERNEGNVFHKFGDGVWND